MNVDLLAGLKNLETETRDQMISYSTKKEPESINLSFYRPLCDNISL